MAIKVYSDYDNFALEEKEISEHLESKIYEDPFEEDDTTDIFMYPEQKNGFDEESSFFVVSDPEEEELAEDIAGYLGKSTKIQLDYFHKVVFCVN
jgi:hypothetical protein